MAEIPATAQSGEGGAPAALQIARPVRPWEFLGVLGTRASVLGHENGRFEAWAYPLKIFRGFHLNFLEAGQVIAGDSIVRTIVVRPESTTLLYTSDTFSVRETIFVPRDKSGAVIRLDIDTSQPLEVEAAFQKDFALEWPAPLGGGSIDYAPRLNAFSFGEAGGRFHAVVGSPSGHEYHEEYSTNLVTQPESNFRLGVVARGSTTQRIGVAGSSTSSQEAEALYHELLAHADEWQRADAALYRQYVASNLRLTLPDRTLESAYEWAEVSLLQGVVTNPDLGTGLVAGYDTSGGDARPGFAWFFGRDALWTSFALTADGDMTTARGAIEFLARYQRADGKVSHEIAQGAKFVPWFTKLPYAYASADATPLFIIAVNDYVKRSGDVAFGRAMWEKVSLAYQFLLSTYEEHGLPRTGEVGHGWIEGGPLYPMRTELYQSGVGLEAVRAMSELASVTGRQPLSDELAKTFAERSKLVDDAFWMPARGHYAFALNPAGQQVDVPSVLATVPMWFGLLNADRANGMITELSAPEHTTDWGMRILSDKDARYDPGGYHWGTVWPLFTGWASVGEYRYHRAVPALQNLEANALLTFAGVPGHVAEVLSGSYFGTLETASPDQIWSSAMVVSPLVRGLLGLEPDAVHNTVRFAPHVPASWSEFGVDHVRAGACELSLRYSRTGAAVNLLVERTGTACTLTFAPALSLRARVRGVLLDGRRIPFHVEANANDQHVVTSFAVPSTPAKLAIEVEDDFGLDEPAALPLVGERSRGVHVLSEVWSPARDLLSLQISGMGGSSYDLDLWNARQISSVDGGSLVMNDGERGQLHVRFADVAGSVATQQVTVHFGRSRNNAVGAANQPSSAARSAEARP